jgi:hypothetical protein
MKQKHCWVAIRLIDGHDTFRGSMPNFFMREMSVVRLISIRLRLRWLAPNCFNHLCDEATSTHFEGMLI